MLVILNCVSLSWLPVWFIADMAYTAELIEQGSDAASRRRLAARLVSVLWVFWVVWAVFRGGKLRHFLWPAAIYLSGMEYWVWSGSPSPEAQVYLILVQMLAFVSASVGIYASLMCTGRQDQDSE